LVLLYEELSLSLVEDCIRGDGRAYDWAGLVILERKKIAPKQVSPAPSK